MWTGNIGDYTISFNVQEQVINLSIYKKGYAKGNKFNRSWSIPDVTVDEITKDIKDFISGKVPATIKEVKREAEELIKVLNQNNYQAAMTKNGFYAATVDEKGEFLKYMDISFIPEQQLVSVYICSDKKGKDWGFKKSETFKFDNWLTNTLEALKQYKAIE
jgi:hypothetical protein